MRILIYGLNYHPEPIGVGKYSGEMAARLAARGHQVRVIAAPPYYPHWRVTEGYSASRYRTETHAGVTIRRCPLWVPAKPSGLRRILHLASFALTSAPLAVAQIRWRPHLVLAVEPPLFCAPTTLLVSRLSRAKAWLHIQDFEIQAAFELGLLSSAPMRRALRAVERFIERRFDRVSTISRAMLRRLADDGIDPAKRVYFPNWVDTHAIHPLPEGNRPFRRRLGIPDGTLVALYAGNMGHKQGLELLGQVAATLTDRTDLLFVFCGTGSGRGDLEAATRDLPNVRFLDTQPVERLNDLLNLADIHLLPQRRGVADLVLPSKLTGMFASGIPVLATAQADTDLARLVRDRGLVVPPANPEAFAAALLRLADDPELRKRLGHAARTHACRTLDREQVLGRFDAELERLVRGDQAG